MFTPRVGWLPAIAMLCAGVLIGAVLTWVVLARPLPFGGDGEAAVDRPPTAFSISGDVSEPFFPGGSAPLDLTISNPLDTDLVVSDLLVEVESVEAPSATALLPCGVDDFAVEQTPTRDELVVEAGTTMSLTELGVAREDLPHVLMLDSASNQDGCKGASFALAYSAVGRAVE